MNMPLFVFIEQAKIAQLCQLNEELEQVKQLEATAKTLEE